VGFSLLGILALAGGAYLERLVAASARTVTVSISADCKVEPETQVGQLDTLIWQPPTAPPPKYSARFDPKKIPFISSANDIPAAHGNVVFADAECAFSHFDPKKCYFRYEVFRDGKKCGDPGVHVGPPRYFYSKASQ